MILLEFLSLQIYVTVASKSYKQNKECKKTFGLASSRSMTEIQGSGSGSKCESISHGSTDPEPPKNVMDPQHWVQPWGVKRDTQTTWIHGTKICTTSSTYT